MRPYNNRCKPMTVPTGKPEIEIDAALPKGNIVILCNSGKLRA
jgi:hypothetical protein